jgi:O-antigen ligase
MQESAILHKRDWIIGLIVLFLGVAAFAYTGSYLMAVAPFAFLFLLLMGANWKLAYFLLLFLIPVSVDLSFFNDTLSTSVPDEPIMWLFLLLLFVLIARQPNIFPQWWLRHPIVFIIALQYLWLLVAVYYSHNLFVSVKFLAAKTWFLTSFFIFPVLVFTQKKDFKKGFLLMLIPIVSTAVIIFVRHAALGFSFFKIEKAIGDIYFNHVDYSTVLSMFFPIALIALPLTKNTNPIIRGFILFIILFLLVAIYFTYARAALVAVVFALGLALALRLRLANLIMPIFYGAITVMVFYFANDYKFMELRPDYKHTYMHHKFTDHIIATFKGEDMSSMERLYRWIAAVRMSQDEPVKGYGPNTFYDYYQTYAVSSFQTYVSRNFEHSTTHNYFLYMLVEQGWPAMILYAILVMAVIAIAQRTYNRFRNRDRFYAYCTLGLTMMFGAGFINNFFSDLIETHKVGSLFYVSIALLVILDKKAKDMEAEELIKPA